MLNAARVTVATRNRLLALHGPLTPDGGHYRCTVTADVDGGY